MQCKIPDPCTKLKKADKWDKEQNASHGTGSGMKNKDTLSCNRNYILNLITIVNLVKVSHFFYCAPVQADEVVNVDNQFLQFQDLWDNYKERYLLIVIPGPSRRYESSKDRN